MTSPLPLGWTASRRGQHWTPDEEAKLLLFMSADDTVADICLRMGRTPLGVVLRACDLMGRTHPAYIPDFQYDEPLRVVIEALPFSMASIRSELSELITEARGYDIYGRKK